LRKNGLFFYLNEYRLVVNPLHLSLAAALSLKAENWRAAVLWRVSAAKVNFSSSFLSYRDATTVA
jgi:hypothetical protein